MTTDRVPVTLKVNIYDRSYNVTYPSNQRVQELQVEFATLCKGRKKSNSSRRYFVCIHCGKDDFTNKLRLNQHRYEDGCDAATYSDGGKALLLPYPDFRPGQGKMVEVMGKVRPLTATQRGVGGEAVGVTHGFDTGDEEDADAGDAVFLESVNVTGSVGSSHRPLVPPPLDMFLGPVPPKAMKAAARPRAARGLGPQDKPALPQGEAVAVKKAGKAPPRARKSKKTVPPSPASARALLPASMPPPSEPSVATVQTRLQTRLVLEPIANARTHAKNTVKGKSPRNANAPRRQETLPPITEDRESSPGHVLEDMTWRVGAKEQQKRKVRTGDDDAALGFRVTQRGAPATQPPKRLKVPPHTITAALPLLQSLLQEDF